MRVCCTSLLLVRAPSSSASPLCDHPNPNPAHACSHYTQKMTVGGMQNVVIKMSASAHSSLQTQDISVEASASASYGLASGSITASTATSDTNAIATSSQDGTFSFQYAPAITIPPPTGGWQNGGAQLTSDQCQGWKDNMKKGNGGQGDYVSAPLPRVHSPMQWGG